MDYQAFVDTCAVPCCVISVDKAGDSYGDIRIVCSNASYKQSMGPAYYDGMLYDELVPHDVKFEDFCFRAAIKKQRMHAYVETKALNGWTDQQMIPLESDDPEKGYCQFLFEITPTADASRMATVSMETAEAVIRSSITMLGATDFIESVKEVQRDILEIAEGFSCRIMLVDHNLKEAIVLCEEFGPGADTSNPPGDGSIPYEIVASWDDMLGVSNDVIVKNAREMDELEKRNPAWVQTMRDYDVHSLVLVPLRRGGSIIGWMYLTNYNTAKTVQVKELIELMSFILGSEIANYLLMQQLEEMSTSDMLTGVFNRNAMLRRMDELISRDGGEPFGIINLDLNGLKVVNDRDGHDAGDALLAQAAGVLKKVFRRGDLFRAGGDEFIVIAEGVSQEVFERKVQEFLDEVERQPHVSFAWGACWSGEVENAREVFLKADERMYLNKRAYYQSHPELTVR